MKKIFSGFRENITYPDSSNFRLLIQRNSYHIDPHWHPCVEIIMPLSRDYQVKIEEENLSSGQGRYYVSPFRHHPRSYRTFQRSPSDLSVRCGNPVFSEGISVPAILFSLFFYPSTESERSYLYCCGKSPAPRPFGNPDTKGCSGKPVSMPWFWNFTPCFFALLLCRCRYSPEKKEGRYPAIRKIIPIRKNFWPCASI